MQTLLSPFSSLFDVAMDNAVRPLHLALFFCECVATQLVEESGEVIDEVAEWCLHRILLSFSLPDDKNVFGYFSSEPISLEDRPTFSSAVEKGSLSETGPSTAPLESGYSLEPCQVDDSENLILEFLVVVRRAAGDEKYLAAFHILHKFLGSVFEESTHMFSLYLIDQQFLMPQQEGNYRENCFSRYRCWFREAWNELDFDTQSYIASFGYSWLQKIKLASTKEHISKPIPSPVVKSLNITSLHASLRSVFEGANQQEHLFSKYLFYAHTVFQIKGELSGADLLDFFNHNAASSGHKLGNKIQSVMSNIASGMLFYARKYLQLRSMEHALLCAEGVVLIERHLYTPSIIALWQLSCFEVHLCNCNARKAADNIVMGLSTLRSRRASVEGYLVGLYYIAGAQFLMLYNGVASASLWSILCSQQKSSTENERVGEREAGENDDQTISHAVLNALLLAEVEASRCLSPRFYWKQVLLSIMRSTVLTQASIYGIASTPIYLHEKTILALCKELQGAEPLLTSKVSESSILIPEMSRLVAHTALACQEETLVMDTPPLSLIYDYLTGIHNVFGTNTMECVETDFFFRSVTSYLVGCWLYEQGFVSSAYEVLEKLVRELYFHAKLPIEEVACGNKYSKENADAKVAFFCDSSSLYWPPDNLLLYNYAQMKRADIARYLGLGEDLKAMMTAVKTISSKADFVFGALVALYIDILYHQHLGKHALATEQAYSLKYASERIGLIPLIKKAAIQTVYGAIKEGSYREALLRLDHCSSYLSTKNSVWYCAVRLNILTELLLRHPKGQTAAEKIAEKCLNAIDFQSISSPQLLLEKFNEPGCNEKLIEIISLQANVHRMNQLCGKQKNEECVDESGVWLGNFLALLHDRQGSRGLGTVSVYLLDTVKDILSGSLLPR